MKWSFSSVLPTQTSVTSLLTKTFYIMSVCRHSDTSDNRTVDQITPLSSIPLLHPPSRPLFSLKKKKKRDQTTYKCQFSVRCKVVTEVIITAAWPPQLLKREGAGEGSVCASICVCVSEGGRVSRCYLFVDLPIAQSWVSHYLITDLRRMASD